MEARSGTKERIPLTVYEPAAAALRVHAIKSLTGKTCNPTEHREVTSHQSVVVVGASKQHRTGESDLVRDLRQRILELETRGPANPHANPTVVNAPTLPVSTGAVHRSDDDAREGIGAGPSAADIAAKSGYRVA